MSRRGWAIAAAVLAATAAPANADRDQTFVEAVVTVRGSGTATCAPAEPVCQGSATVDVVLAGPSHPGVAGTVPATLWVGNGSFYAPASISLDIEGRHVEVAFYERSCHAYGPDHSSGPGAGAAVIERSGAEATATFACTAVLIERIL